MDSWKLKKGSIYMQVEHEKVTLFMIYDDTEVLWHAEDRDIKLEQWGSCHARTQTQTAS